MLLCKIYLQRTKLHKGRLLLIGCYPCNQHNMQLNYTRIYFYGTGKSDTMPKVIGACSSVQKMSAACSNTYGMV